MCDLLTTLVAVPSRSVPLQRIRSMSFAERIAIYRRIVDTGEAPPVAVAARALGLDRATVEHAYRALADAHVIVLQPGQSGDPARLALLETKPDVLWAPPFSAVPTAFRVSAGRATWYAPCAWDAFGIPAALDGDARIDAQCGWSGDPLPCGVEHGHAYGTGIIHLLVPAAHFWDDIGYT
jgi:DNA-binding transcriptional ArsR family regulator